MTIEAQKEVLFRALTAMLSIAGLGQIVDAKCEAGKYDFKVRQLSRGGFDWAIIRYYAENCDFEFAFTRTYLSYEAMLDQIEFATSVALLSKRQT